MKYNHFSRRALALLLSSALLIILCACSSSPAPTPSDAFTLPPSLPPSPSETPSDGPTDDIISYTYDDSDFGVKFDIMYPKSWTLIELKAWKGDATREGSPSSCMQIQFSGDTECFTIGAMLYTPFELDPERYAIEAFTTGGGLSGQKYTDLSGSQTYVYYLFNGGGEDPRQSEPDQGSGPYYFASVTVSTALYDVLRDDIDAVMRSLVIDTNPGSSPVVPTEVGLPDQIEISVEREGMNETLTGALAVSSRFGYAVYVLPGFTFFERDGCDTVEFDSPLPITLQLYSVDPSDPLLQDHESDGIRYDYKRVNVGDKTIQLVLCYPPEAIEGGLVLLHAMANTLQPVGATGGSPSAYQTKEDFLNSTEGELFRDVSRSAANAMLSADARELALYMENPSDAAKAVKGLTDVINEVAFIELVFGPDSMKSYPDITVSYRYALSGEDSFSYVTMELVKIDGVWKVRWIGIEK